MFLEHLMNHFPQTGVVQWMGIRAEKKAELVSVNKIKLDPIFGMEGDHYSGGSGKRHVTLIQAEHLAVIASLMGMELVQAELLRRNIVIHGLNLLALKNKSFQPGVVSIGSECKVK